MSAALCEALGTDDVDLVDLRTVSPTLAKSVFDHGVPVVGDPEHASQVRRQLVKSDTETPSPRERLDTALAKIDTHLDGDGTGVPVASDSKDGG